jgi:hypothetical protein|eukprot:COSAG03_NODE_6274_length_1085_cov_1.405680_1_plen_80_part_00
MSVQVVRWDISMLPKAATCYNALQLPPYPSEAIMRQVSFVSSVATTTIDFQLQVTDCINVVWYKARNNVQLVSFEARLQ